MANGSLASLIPVVYYDLIARVSAGAPFAALALIRLGWSPFQNETPEIVIVLLIFGGGYLIGTILTTLNAPWVYLVWVLILRYKHFGLDSGKPHAAFREAYSRMDNIHNQKQSEGGVLVKMEAGAALAESLASGTALVVAWMEIVELWSVVLVVVLVATAILRRWLFLERLEIFWKLKI